MLEDTLLRAVLDCFPSTRRSTFGCESSILTTLLGKHAFAGQTRIETLSGHLGFSEHVELRPCLRHSTRSTQYGS